jgi:ADP-ribose pyrophosphatase YjhB (NUDIX family)
MKKILLDAFAIQTLLKAFKDAGYDRIHISGGTSKDGAHYAGIIVYKYDKELKRFVFVGLPYDSLFYKREANGDKVAGHTKKDNELPKETAQRELFEETGLKVDDLRDLVEVYRKEIDDNRPEFKGQKHMKYYYMINIDKCSGELSSFEGENPIDGETLAPELFIKEEFMKILFKGHQLPLQKTFEKLKLISLEYYYAL